MKARNAGSLVSLVRSCSNATEVAQAHQLILRSDHRGDVGLSNLVIKAYGRCRSLNAARQVFDSIPQPNRISWNMMLQAYACNHWTEQAKQLFDMMPQRDVISWTALLSAFAGRGLVDDATTISRKMPLWDVVSCTTTVVAHAQAGQMEEARAVFEAMQCRDVAAWNALVDGYTRSGLWAEATSLVARMPEHDCITGTAMVAAFAQCKELQFAKALFDELPSRDVTTWTALMGGVSQHWDAASTREVYKRMPQWDSVAQNAMLAAAVGSTSMLESIFHGSMHQGRDAVSWNTMISSYSHNGDMMLARKFFDYMPQWLAASWNAVMAGYSENGKLEEAERIFHYSPERNLVSWNALVSAYARGKHLEDAREAFCRMPCWDSVSFAAVLLAMIAGGELQGARQAFECMPERGLPLWNTLLAAYAQNGHRLESVGLFHEMASEGVVADVITFIGILASCSHAGKPDDARQYFQSMVVDFGILPVAQHYHCVVDALARAGRVLSAKELVETMPLAAQDVAWTSLLGGCAVNGDLNMGAQAAEMALKTTPSRTSPYVLLSNMVQALESPKPD